MAETADPVVDGVIARRRARRRRHRRQLFVGGLAVALVAGGAGTAWAMRGSSGTEYRLATVVRGAVRQTVGADGTLAAHRTASAAFAAAGTVSSVAASMGDRVDAGQTLATLDPASLNTAVTSARTAVAQAQQQLADDEQAQADGTSSTSATNATSNATTNAAATAGFSDNAVLTSQVTTTGKTGARGGSTDSGTLTSAQHAVVTAQQKLDKAVSAQDKAVQTLVTSCASSDESTPTTVRASADGDGTVSGSGGASAVVVTLLDSNGDVADTNSANPQRLAENGSYQFTGLDAGRSYTVSLVRSAVVNTADCTGAVSDVEQGQRTMDSKVSALDTALAALTKALAAQPSGQGATQGTTQGTSQGSTKGSTQGSTKGSTRSGTGTSGASTQATSGAQAGSQTGTPVTAEQLAADAKAIDAAKAELAVARSDRSHATLTTPIAGTVAAVDIAKGDNVSAGSSAQVVTVVGNGALTVELDISLADIDLVKAGQSAQVTVDGHTGTLPAKVTYVGQTNSGDSTGSSSTYTVTIQLTRTYPSLYDGMGADVAIDVGTVAGTLTVPVSAVHTTGSLHTVLVDSASGTVTRTPVTIGLVGDSLVQVKSGLKAGQKVVIADISAAVPSSDTSSNSRGNRSGFGSFGTGGTGGPPGGR